MSNMHYCQFRNTLGDLRNCEDAFNNGALDDDDINDDEKEAMVELLKLCKELSGDYDY